MSYTETTALVPFLRKESRDEQAQMPFEEFVAMLMERHAFKSKRTMSGAVVWSALPIEYVLADGLWMVMIRAAQKLRRQMVTTQEALEHIAPRVNRLVNAGLAIKYASTEDAVQAFESDVIEVIHQPMEDGNDNALRPLQHSWQLPSARFFADLLKVAQARSDEMRRRLSILVEQNNPDAGRAVEILDEYHFQRFPAAVSYADLKADARISEREYCFSILRDGVEILETLERVQAVLSALPYAVMKLPATIIGMDVEIQWMNTQVFLAAAGLPDAEVITSKEFLDACERVLKTPFELVMPAFIRRMRNRGMRVEDVNLEVLGKLVNRAWQNVKCHAENPSVNTILSCEFIMDIRMVDISLPARYALDAAKGLEQETANLPKYVTGGSNALKPNEVDWMRTNIVNAIAWSEVSAEDVEAMWRDGPLPPKLIAEGVSRMRPEQQEAAVERLMLIGNPHEVVDVLIAVGAASSMMDFLVRFCDVAPHSVVAKYLPEMFMRVREDKAFANTVPVSTLVRLVSTLSRDDVSRIMNMPIPRRVFVKCIAGEIANPDWRLAVGVNRELMDVFLNVIEPNLWYSAVLAYEVVAREQEYACGSEQEAGEPIPRWEDISGNTLRTLARSLGVTQRKARAFLQEKTEDEMLNWLYAGAGDEETRLAEYRRSRALYFGNE